MGRKQELEYLGVGFVSLTNALTTPGWSSGGKGMADTFIAAPHIQSCPRPSTDPSKVYSQQRVTPPSITSNGISIYDE